MRWKTPRNTSAKNKFSFATPLAIELDGATQIISPASGFMAGYAPEDGREIWRARYGGGYSVITRPVFAHGLLFVSSSFDKPVLYAIKPDQARGDVTETHVAWTHPRAPNTPSPVVVGNEIYFVSDSGLATCLDARTGKVHWSQERLDAGFSASPVAAEGRLYFQSEAGLGLVLKAGTAFQVLARNNLGERTLASPVGVDNTLFLRSQSHLWRIGQ